MARRTPNDWKILVEKQISSGLSVPQFCEQHKLSSNYFYGRKSLFKQTTTQANFVQATVINQQTELIHEQQSLINIKTSVAELSLPGDTSAQFLVELLSGLAS